jgi:hypothetical protein
MDKYVAAINQGLTGWINSVSKEQLLQIAEFLDIAVNPATITLDELRKIVREHVKNREKSSKPAMGTVGKLEPFSGGNWQAYKQQLDCYINLNDVSEQKKLPLLITKLKPHVYDILSSLCAPTVPVDATYDEICNKLKAHYNPIEHSSLHKAQFRQRKQNAGETIAEYILSLRELGKKCNFADVDEQIKERLIDGVADNFLRFELLKISDKSLSDMINIAKLMEIAYKNSSPTYETKVLKHNETPVKKTYSDPSTSKDKTAAKPTRKAGVSICFCCGKEGHLRSECRLINKFCSECGQRGHLFKMCKNEQAFAATRNVQLLESDKMECSDLMGNSSDQDHEDEYKLYVLSHNHKIEPMYLEVKIKNYNYNFEIDTGADVSTLSYDKAIQLFKEEEIKPCKLLFKNFDQTVSSPIGVLDPVTVKFKNEVYTNLRLYVVKENLPNVVGKDWLMALNLWPLKLESGLKQISTIHTNDSNSNIVQQLKKQYANLFSPGWGNLKEGR